MIDLRDIEHDTLRDLARAGADGLDLGSVGASVAIRLELASLASITKGAPQRVRATAQGVAFSRRSVFA